MGLDCHLLFGGARAEEGYSGQRRHQVVYDNIDCLATRSSPPRDRQTIVFSRSRDEFPKNTAGFWPSELPRLCYGRSAF